MALDILLTVAGTSLVQSIFGVGVLLFGTPILLGLEHDFLETITILLPISLVINLFQIIKDYKMIDMIFYKKILSFAIPFVVIFLFFVTAFEINIRLIVGIFLLIVAIKDYSIKLQSIIESLMKYENFYLILMGIVHGATNLGGSLLSAIIHNKKYEKNMTRATIAASYATFAAFQIATLMFSSSLSNINFKENCWYLIVGVIIFILTETTLYLEINSQSYGKYFAMFLFASGIVLCVKSI